MDILLVLGNVPPAQCQHLALAMRRRGLEPMVVHVPERYAESSRFISHTLAETITTTHTDAQEDSRIQVVIAGIVRECFGEATLDQVKVIVKDDALSEIDGDSRWGWLQGLVPVDIPEYVVRPMNDDSGFWLDGTGLDL
jgi:hypothetical protein